MLWNIFCRAAFHSYLDHCKRMYIFEDKKFNRCQKLNKILLRLIGLWPCGRTKYDRFRAICCFTFLISCLIIELKQMFEEVSNTRRMLTNVQEIEIIEYYIHQGEKITILLTSLQTITIFSFLALELLPDVFDFFKPINKSRSHYLIDVTEYHINEGIQYYFFFFCAVTSILIASSATILVISIILSVCLHCCALFKICSYRIKQFVDEKVITSSNKRIVIVERQLQRIVELHQKTKQLAQLMTSSFTISYLSILVIGICSFAVSLYSLLQAITNDTINITEVLTAIVSFIGHKLILFLVSFGGQLLINHADDLFIAIYMSLWYETPVTVQKLLLFIMQISSKSLVISCGGIFVIAMETFASITRTAISFMMVISSIAIL
ncbi:uncharacterized protein LOC105827874 [Monomorium pharaonis]|uniref:uncharacterized protein LOC105827874 n=1 Tax=Monomorium pharaonis TaxID=307658 RepID=UPI00102E12FC|nr:uncharacterized protein LOC105827874 [Monomorium pharaonis]